MRRALLAMALSIFLGALLVGCKNSPGDVFSPKSDIHIKKVTPFRIALDLNEYKVDDGKAAFTPEITSGIAAMVKGARVEYYSQSGRLFSQRTVVTQVWVAAADYTTFPASGTASTTTTTTTTTTTDTSSTAEGDIIIQIGDKLIFDAMKAREEYSLLAKVVVFGTDENANNFEITTQIPVALEPKSTVTTTGGTGT